MTDEEHDDLIEAYAETADPPIQVQVFASALGRMLKNTEGVVVHLNTEHGTLGCVVYRDDANGMIKIIPDVEYTQYADGTMIWMHESKEECESAQEKQRNQELH